jgi:hypothetical protein
MARLQTRRFDVDDYYRMADAGILHEDDRVELIEGEIVEMVPTGPNRRTRAAWTTSTGDSSRAAGTAQPSASRVPFASTATRSPSRTCSS